MRSNMALFASIPMGQVMEADSKFRAVQLRAYEIYRRRDPHNGNADEDWREAETQIEREQHRGSGRELGPAKHKDKSHWGRLGTHQGEDFENPT